MDLGGTQKEELARDEGEPIGSGLLDNDTVDQVVKPFESQLPRPQIHRQMMIWKCLGRSR